MIDLSQRAVEWIGSQSWQILLLVLVLALIWRASRNASAHWRYLLGLLVLAKCVIPAFAPLPVPERVSSVIQVATNRLSAQSKEGQSFEGPSPGIEIKPAVPSRCPFPLGRICAFVWLTGALATLGFAGVKALHIQCNLRRTRAEPDLELECEFLDLGRRVGLRRRPKLCLLASAGQPFVWGLWQGCIYLPTSFPRQGKPQERQVVLAHELAHVLRWDALVNFFQVVVQAIFWFHPAVWWLNKRLRQEREKCCDEMAIAALGVDARAYGTALVGHLVARFHPAVPVSSLAISGQAKDLENRLTNILKPDRLFRCRPSAAAVMVCLFAAVVVLPAGVRMPWSSLNAAEPDVQPKALVFAVQTGNNWASSGHLFAELPMGDRRLGGTQWVVKGVTPVNAASSVVLNAQTTFSKCHLLHGSDGAADAGTAVACVRFHYSDGKVAEVPIRYGEHVQDCRFGAFSPVRDPGTVMAWTGANPELRASGLGLRLYRTTLINPRPTMRVSRIEYLAQVTHPIPLLAAVTIE